MAFTIGRCGVCCEVTVWLSLQIIIFACWMTYTKSITGSLCCIPHPQWQSNQSLEDYSYSSSWLLSHPNARSIFWWRPQGWPFALTSAIDYTNKYGTEAGWWSRGHTFLGERHSISQIPWKWGMKMENTLAVNRLGTSKQSFTSTCCFAMNIHRHLVIACTLPITRAEAE